MKNRRKTAIKRYSLFLITSLFMKICILYWKICSWSFRLRQSFFNFIQGLTWDIGRKWPKLKIRFFKLLVTKRDYWRWRDWTFSSILLPLAVELKIVNSHTRFHNRAKTINIGDCQNETLKKPKYQKVTSKVNG